MTPWTFWIVLSAILAVAEMMTGTFYLLVLSIGALAGAASAAMQAGSSVQIFVAACVGIVGFVVLQRFRPAENRAHVSENPDVNPDIGAIVRLSVVADDGRARVFYRGTEWNARVQGADALLNTDYRIAAVEGATLVLHPVT